jgi:hypothetical protein
MTPNGEEEARNNTGNELCFDELVVRFSHETERMLAGLRSIVRMANRFGEFSSKDEKCINDKSKTKPAQVF